MIIIILLYTACTYYLVVHCALCIVHNACLLVLVVSVLLLRPVFCKWWVGVTDQEPFSVFAIKVASASTMKLLSWTLC